MSDLRSKISEANYELTFCTADIREYLAIEKFASTLIDLRGSRELIALVNAWDLLKKAEDVTLENGAKHRCIDTCELLKAEVYFENERGEKK